MESPPPIDALLSSINNVSLEAIEIEKYISDLKQHHTEEVAGLNTKVLRLEARIKFLESRRPAGYFFDRVRQHCDYSLKRINRFFDWAGFW